MSVARKKQWYISPLVYLTMILLGIISGYSNIIWLQNLGIFIADIFIKMFKFVSLPIISLSIIVTFANYNTDGSMKNIWRRAIRYTLGTTLVAALISAILYLIIKPAMVLVHPVQFSAGYANKKYLQHILDIIPSNIITPFIEHQVMGVLLISIIVGIAIHFIPDKLAKDTLKHFFQGAHGLFMVITRWIVTIIPLALYGFITGTIVQLRTGMQIQGIGEYLAVIILANLIQGLVILPLWLKMHGINPVQGFKNMFPALVVAFFSKSSVGTLPVTMDTAEKNWRIKPAISRFVLPLCTSLNMNGCAAFIFTTVIYLMQNNGHEITLITMGLWIIIATIAAIGNAGVPMGCFFLSTSLLVSMNVPINLLGLILPFYSIIDMLETSLNVWSDSCVAKVVSEKDLADRISEKST